MEVLSRSVSLPAFLRLESPNLIKRHAHKMYKCWTPVLVSHSFITYNFLRIFLVWISVVNPFEQEQYCSSMFCNRSDIKVEQFFNQSICNVYQHLSYLFLLSKREREKSNHTVLLLLSQTSVHITAPGKFAHFVIHSPWYSQCAHGNRNLQFVPLTFQKTKYPFWCWLRVND